MTATAFDTLKLARRLEAAGLSAAQAAGVAEALVETVVADPATRSDLMSTEAALRGDMARFESSLRGEMAALETSLRAEIVGLRAEVGQVEARLRGEMNAGFAAVKVDILRWMVPLLLAQMGITLGLFARLSG